MNDSWDYYEGEYKFGIPHGRSTAFIPKKSTDCQAWTLAYVGNRIFDNGYRIKEKNVYKENLFQCSKEGSYTPE